MYLSIYGVVLPTHNTNSKPNPNANPNPNRNPNKAGHGLQYFTILAIEQFEENSESIHHMKKRTWQHLLQTAHPLGINNLKPRFLLQ